ncbi:MAG: hypothetical protein IGS48_02795 [Oscillatoriales cyanobacterium C42_A2020_001]|nr:hypothetical protein [Leptolyngbyaceae cyanobacterium C42_A2020_001]
MFDLNSLLAFSHTYCIAICAVLVPFNLLTTLLTLLLVGTDRPSPQVRRSTGFAIAGAVLMLLHVLTWLLVGVVKIPTFVLFTLATCCLSLNGWALWHPRSLHRGVQRCVQIVRNSFQSMVQRTEAS